MSLSKKLLLSTIFVLLLVSLGGAGVIYLSWQREVLTSELMEQIGSAHADTFARLHVMGLAIAGLAFGSGVVVFLFMVWNSWLSVVRVAVPLGRFSGMLGNSSGTVAIDSAIERDAKRRDEIGSIARAILDLCRSRAQLEDDEKERRLEAAEKEKRHAAMEQVVKNFGLSMNEVVGSLSAAAAELETSAHAMDQTALQTNNLAATLMEESQKVDASMHDVASAEGALSQTIGQIRGKVHTARDITEKAVTEAQDSRKNISQLVDEVNKIGEVLTLISEIAAQTNLLALNATIEAARAGEVGKGFAVVASEVKNLASETARATEDIAERIKRIQAATVTSSQTIDAFAETVASIGQISADITQSVDLQGEATDSIARSVNTAAASTETFSTNVGEVTRAAAETGQAVRGVTAASTHVARQSEALHKLADGFMADIKNLE